jgi:hypothetical protein
VRAASIFSSSPWKCLRSSAVWRCMQGLAGGATI